MLSRASLVLLPVIQAVISFQKDAGADGAGHQVGAVEAEDRVGVLEDLDRQLVDRARDVGDRRGPCWR